MSKAILKMKVYTTTNNNTSYGSLAIVHTYTFGRSRDKMSDMHVSGRPCECIWMTLNTLNLSVAVRS